MEKQFISFIIPAKNEEKSIAPLFNEISSEMKKLGNHYEVIFIDDGSTDNTYGEFKKLHEKDNHVKVVKHRGNWGKSVAIKSGFSQSAGNLIITMDADLQDNPTQISKFLNKLSQGYDMVSGWKKTRHDPLTKVLPSKVFNFLVRVLTGVNIHDINCGFKIYKREVFEGLNIYAGLYRFIPVFAAKQNYKVGEIVVAHRPRKYGFSKFGWERFLRGFLDLITVFFIVRYLKKPMHIFGTIGLLFFAIGTLIGIFITYLRITLGNIGDHYPLLFLGILLMVVGVQMVSTGLIGELIININQSQAGISPNTIEEVLI